MNKNQIEIYSLTKVLILIATKKTNYNIVSIRDPEDADEIHQIFKRYKENYQSVFPAIFDDIQFAIKGYTAPDEGKIKDILEWSRNKNNLLVHCNAGISRSSAIAYLIACTQKEPAEAIKVLDPAMHWPNRLIVEIGSKVLGNPEIIQTLNEKYDLI